MLQPQSLPCSGGVRRVAAPVPRRQQLTDVRGGGARPRAGLHPGVCDGQRRTRQGAGADGLTGQHFALEGMIRCTDMAH